MIQPRWYQEEAITSLFNYFERSNGNPLIALPTGAGKSLVIALFLHTVMKWWPNQRIIVGTHVKELIRQNANEFMGVWPNAPAGIYSAGLRQRDIHLPITFAGIASICKTISAFGHIDLFIIDEAHLLGSNDDGMYNIVIGELRKVNPKLKVIGLTATPWRSGMGLLTNGNIFTDIIYNICDIPGFKRLFAEGYLVPPRAKATQNIMDVSNVGLVNGEFSQVGLQREAAKNELVTWQALQESLNRGSNRHCRLVFCAGINHAILCAEMLKALGCRVGVVHSKMSDKERDGILQAYFSGELDTLTNNGIATTGINHKPIDHIINLRATQRVGLWVQMIGRGTRPFECEYWIKEDCLVTDHAGNTPRLGTIDDPYIPKLKSKDVGDMPVKLCPACGEYNHASARVCSDCGQPFETRIGYQKQASDVALIKSDAPLIETYKVDVVYYTRHVKKGDPHAKPVMQASYRCGLQRFVEFIAFEAGGYGSKRARDWWRERFPIDGFVPINADEALKYMDKLRTPVAIKVWVNKKYPEVVGYEY